MSPTVGLAYTSRCAEKALTPAFLNNEEGAHNIQAPEGAMLFSPPLQEEGWVGTVSTAR